MCFFTREQNVDCLGKREKKVPFFFGPFILQRTILKSFRVSFTMASMVRRLKDAR